MDISGDFSNNRIKGVLKPFGKIIELELELGNKTLLYIYGRNS